MSGEGEPAPAPPTDAVLAVDPGGLAARLGAIPDADNALLRLADGRRSVARIVEEAGGDPGAARAALGRLLEAGVLRVVASGAPAPRPGPDGADWFASPSAATRPPPAEAARPSASGPASASAPGSPDDPGVMVIAAPPGAERARRRARAWALAALGAAAVLLLGRALLVRLHP